MRERERERGDRDNESKRASKSNSDGARFIGDKGEGDGVGLCIR